MTINPVTINPGDIRGGDQLGFKIIAVVDESGHFWSAFRGLTEWSDSYTAAHGDRIGKDVAEGLFYALAVRDDLQYYE